MSRLSFWFSLFALIISVHSAAFLLPYRWVGDTAYTLSTWSGDARNGMTLKLYGIVPIGYCYGISSTVEEEKRCVIGNDRYQRFHRPSERSEG